MQRQTLPLVLFSLFVVFLAQGQERKLSLEDIWATGKFAAKKAPDFKAMNDGRYYSNTAVAGEGKVIIRYEMASGKAMDTIANSELLNLEGKTLNFHDYTFSDDESMILLETDPEMIYRHSSRSDYYLLNRSSGKMSKLSGNGKMMFASFSPDGKHIGFVRDNNLWLINTSTLKEIQVTTDGKKNSIINGTVDWVYEEEFSMDKGFEWSSDSRRIAYYRFDESGVKEFNLTTYGTLYPKEETYKYPKAGEANSKVEIYVYNITDGKTVKMQTGEWEYLPRMKWTVDPLILSIQRTNRHQNILELIFCNANDGKSRLVLRDTNDTFIEITDDLTFLKDGKRFIWTSSRDGFNHIYLYGTDGKLIRQITKGNYDVTSYYGFDENSSTFYYQSAEPNPNERMIAKTTLSGKKTILSKGPGVHKASFSKGMLYFLDTWSDFNTPYTSALFNTDGKQLRVLEDNSGLKKTLKEFNLGKSDTFSIVTSDKLRLYGWRILPPDYDAGKKYPVLVYLYGGPGKQTVINEWAGATSLWHHLMAGEGYIIVSVDNRGTPGRGIEFANSIHRNMGALEVKDQLEVAEWIKKQNWADPQRIGVWGWSYGGYMTSLLMSKGNGVYKAGIAVAPVTNWRYYDSIYTERYLQTPQENPEGYDNNSPINFAADLKGRMMLVHGSGDDNVHYQNTMEYINALVKHNKQFDLMIYPNRNHGIGGGGARLHLFTMMTGFLKTNL